MVETPETLQMQPPVALAPLAGITDLPFRNLVGGFGAGLVVSEMIASGELLSARSGTRERAELGAGDKSHRRLRSYRVEMGRSIPLV